MKKLLSALLIATLTGLVGAPGAFASDDEKFDPVHHASDGYYIDLEPGGKLELPRIFLIRTAEGSIGLAFYGSTAAALSTRSPSGSPASFTTAPWPAIRRPRAGAM